MSTSFPSELSAATADPVLRAGRFLASQWEVPERVDGSFTDTNRVFNAVTSGKWRRTSMDAHSIADTRAKIEVAVRSGLDLGFSVPFGGYKSWRVPESPHLNWADIFALNYISRYGDSVARTVEIPIQITFSYVGRVMNIINNIPIKHQETYINEFRKAIVYFDRPHVKMSLFDIVDLFPGIDALTASLWERYEDVRENWDEYGGEAKKRLESASRNFMVCGEHDYSMLGERDLGRMILQSAMLCEALDSLPERRNFNKYSTRIQLVQVHGPKPAVHISSCETSANHFGVGRGVVEIRGGRCLQRITTARANWPPPEIPTRRFKTPSEAHRGFHGLKAGFFVTI